MRKILVAGTAALFTAMAFAASTVPASAGSNVHFSIGVGGWGPGWGHHGGIYVGAPHGGYNNTWAAHVDWCYDHKGPSYNPNNNTYINHKGKVRHCDSPFI